MEDVKLSLEDAYQQIGFRNYQLAGGDEHHVRFFALGCQGSASNNQQDVADLMARIAKDPSHEPDFILILGDNFYDDGVDSPTSKAFKAYFYDIYNELIKLRIPFFICLGNHDANRHAKTIKKIEIYEATRLDKIAEKPSFGRFVEQNQYMHSYLSDADQRKIYTSTDPTPHADPEKIALYQQEELDLSKMPTWNMPYEAYGLHKGDTQIFCLNSNNYLRDYLLYVEYKNNPEEFKKNYPKYKIENNQAYWLQAEFSKAKDQNKKIIFAMHHSLETEGKRAFPNKFDATHYLSPDKLTALKLKLNTKTESYNELLALTFEQQGIWPDEVLAAHDHFINYRNTHLDTDSPRKLAQLTLGGGGGDHHPRKSFRGHPFSSHFESYGFAEVTVNKIDAVSINNRIYTIDTLVPAQNPDPDLAPAPEPAEKKCISFTFTEKDHFPIRLTMDDNKIGKLRNDILLECNRYLSSLKNLEKPKKPELANSSSTISTSYFGMFKNALTYFGEVVYMLYEFSKEYMYSNSMTTTVSAVHNMIAYFNRDTALPDIEKIRSDIKMMLQTLIDLKDPVTDNILKPFIAILNPDNDKDNIPRSHSAPNLSSHS